jgi:hypothetical protein
MAAGRVIDAVYASGRESLDGDRAVTALKQSEGKVAVVIYFLEGGAPFVEVTPSVGMPAGTAPAAPAPVEVMRPPEAGPVPAETVITAPAPAPAPVPPSIPEADVKVVLPGDPAIRPRHPSKLAAVEALEDRSIVLVDGLTLEWLGVKDGSAVSMVIPGGRVAQVTVQLMDLVAEPGKFAVLPRKLRRRLAVAPGTIVTLKQGSALALVR